ncbi:MAG TPA: hypothetical protein VK988_10490, partial [Acidimicrobiales bacterium]|nr:hypothetical protein [Acidimicrobiales bacterium]
TASAWACVPQPAVLVQPRSSGAAGTEVTVIGRGFGDSRAEIRWNAFDGELLGALPGPDFTTDVTIPQAPTGLYTLVVIVRGPDGAVANTVRAPFEVVEAGSPATSAAGLPDSPATGPSPAPARASSGRATAALVLALLAIALASAALLLGSLRQRTSTAKSIREAGA